MDAPSNLFNLSGRTALVTGAAGYLGRAIVQALMQAGASVYANTRTEERFNQLVENLDCGCDAITPAIFDVTDHESINAFFSEWGSTPLNIIVNNAYQGGSGTIETATTSAYESSYEVAVISAHTLLRAALGALRAAVRTAGDASVVNIASMYGIISPDLRIYDTLQAGNPPFYGAAKAALIQWSRYAACEFGHEGIRVNAVSPGPFPSESVQARAPGFIAKLVHKVPMNRIGQLSDIGGPVVFLASDAAAYVNGANLIVDGGWTAW